MREGNYNGLIGSNQLRIYMVKNSLVKHKPWFPHPETPERLKYVLNGIKGEGLEEYLEDISMEIKPEIQEYEELLLKSHCKNYLRYLEEMSRTAPVEIDPDTYITHDTLELAIESYVHSYSITRADYKYKILLNRPPGHHAGKCGKAMNAATQGFCLLNNAAAAVHSLLDNGYTRIAVLDFDIHHGNGTQEIFYKTDKVLHVDIHRDPSSFYPYTGFPSQIGKGRGRGYSVNLIIGPLAGDDYYEELVSIAEKLLWKYKPQQVIVSMGFDGYMGDGLADTRLSIYTYNKLGQMLHYLGIPVTSVLEGGYTLGLQCGLPAYIKGLLGINVNVEKTKTPNRILEEYRRVNNETILRIEEIWGGG